jgi:hypothetical protein
MRPQPDDTTGPAAAAGAPDARDTGAPGASGTRASGARDTGASGANDTGAPGGVAGEAHGGGSELRITVARSGGIAGIAPQWTVTASEEADVDSWLSLVESCPWDAPDPADGAGASGAPGGPIGGGVDRFVYTIRVFLPTDEERDARVPEQRLDGPWRDLVDRVKDAGRAEPRASR